MSVLRYISTPLIGATLGWLMAEPWTNNYGFFRDWMLFFLLALGISLGVLVNQAIFFKKLKLIVPIVKNFKLYLIPLLGAFIIKMFLTSWSGDRICSPDTSIDNTILVLDVSSSMEGRALKELKIALGEYLDLLSCSNSKDMISCITFESTASVYFPASNDYSHLKSQIQQLGSRGGTEMALGLELAFNTFSPNETEKYSLILVADGKSNNSDIRSFIANNDRIPIHTIGVGRGYDRDILQFISSQTNGNFYGADNVSELANVFEQVASVQGLTNTNQPELNNQMSPTRRFLGWILLGLVIGLTIGLIDKRKEMLIISIIGGVIGGAVSSALFSLINNLSIQSGSMLRMITFIIFGAFLGLSIYYVQQIHNKLNRRNSSGNTESFSDKLDRE